MTEEEKLESYMEYIRGFGYTYDTGAWTTMEHDLNCMYSSEGIADQFFGEMEQMTQFYEMMDDFSKEDIKVFIKRHMMNMDQQFISFTKSDCGASIFVKGTVKEMEQ